MAKEITRNYAFHLIISAAKKIQVELTNIKYEAVRDCYRCAWSHDRALTSTALNAEMFMRQTDDDEIIQYIVKEMQLAMEAPRSEKDVTS